MIIRTWFLVVSCLTARKFQRCLKSNKVIKSERTVLNLLCASARYKNDNCDTCTCTRMHAHTCAYDIIGNSQGFPKWGRPFAWNYHVYHMCMSAHACAHVWGTPQPPPSPSTQPPTTPRAAGSPKHQNSISLELIEIIRICLKILYLWTFLNSYRL